MPHEEILLAADDAETRESLAACLRTCGFGVDIVASASAALDLVRQEDYAVSLMDLSGWDFETVEQIRRLRPRCFLIVLTTSERPSRKLDGLEIVAKPCDPQDLLLRVGRILQIRKLERENAALREQLGRQAESTAPPPDAIGAGMKLQDMEKILITATIQHTRGNIKEAASVLGIDRSTLYEKIKRYGIPR